MLDTSKFVFLGFFFYSYHMYFYVQSSVNEAGEMSFTPVQPHQADTTIATPVTENDAEVCRHTGV
jgi:hypothetical protein